MSEFFGFLLTLPASIPFHFCGDELLALTALLPAGSVAAHKARTWLHCRRCCGVDNHEPCDTLSERVASEARKGSRSSTETEE